MPAITPKCLEDVAQSYYLLIQAGELTLSDVPAKPVKVYNRVEELLRENGN